MGLFDKLERRLERGVNGVFARAFRSEVQPVEIASALRRAMDDRASSIGKGHRPIVPNVFAVELSPTDFDRLTEYEDSLADELIASAAEHADTQRYRPGGPVTVTFSENDELETGVFRVRPSIAKHAGSAPGREAPAARIPEPEPWQREPFAPPGQQSWRGHDRCEDGSAMDRYTEDGRCVDDQYAEDAAPYRAPRGLDVSPAAPRGVRRRPWLDIDGDRYPLYGAITVIGRDDDADIVLDDPGVSRRHTEIRVTNDGPHLVMTLRDLGSTNGTFVNGDRIERARLHESDRITVGRIALIVHEGGHR